MKKAVLNILFILILAAPCFAADKIHVKALESFSSARPEETFKVEVIEAGALGDIRVIKGDIINCSLDKVIEPKRAKRDAKIIFNLINYEDKLGSHEFNFPLSARYSRTIVSKEEIKKAPKRNIVKKGVSTAADMFLLKGISYGISFADGVVQNKEGNRFKSGAKQVYDDSFLSFVEYGKEIEIKENDEFYLIIKNKKDNDDETDKDDDENNSRD